MNTYLIVLQNFLHVIIDEMGMRNGTSSFQTAYAPDSHKLINTHLAIRNEVMLSRYWVGLIWCKVIISCLDLISHPGEV
jgi:hypothetical protein